MQTCLNKNDCVITLTEENFKTNLCPGLPRKLAVEAVCSWLSIPEEHCITPFILPTWLHEKDENFACININININIMDMYGREICCKCMYLSMNLDFTCIENQCILGEHISGEKNNCTPTIWALFVFLNIYVIVKIIILRKIIERLGY